MWIAWHFHELFEFGYLNVHLSKWLVANVNVHTFSWAIWIWLFKDPFHLNVWLQIKQVNGLKFSWTAWVCLSKHPFCPNDCLQIKQVNGFTFSWTVWLCIFKYPFCPNDWLQIKQVNGFTFSWTAWECISSDPFIPNVFPWTSLKCHFKFEVFITRSIILILLWTKQFLFNFLLKF